MENASLYYQIHRGCRACGQCNQSGLGFKVGRRLENGISWFVEAKNLTDERYAATTGVVANAGPNPASTSRSFLPGDGRGVFAGVEWKW